ncbi:hypothetical protein H5410_019930 [Solanum commersonii]|uniref:Uncharacterized protein n=1 Tax=Solanum commersonii TaxID=4109 RepID=A0A9J5Z700_SOLCO|nr:hypothetical protein H5410_019930 [Solanum commersonii]
MAKRANEQILGPKTSRRDSMQDVYSLYTVNIEIQVENDEIQVEDDVQIIMPPRRAVRGRPTKRNVEEQWVPNAPEVQPQGGHQC